MLDKKIINFEGLSRYHEKLNAVLKTKQDVISDLDEIRSGAAAGSTALQDIPDSSITFDKLNQEVLDELYGYGLEIYSSVDELPDDADQGTLATVVNYYSGEVLVEDKFSVRDIYVGENPDCDPILEFRFNEITSYPEQFGDGFQAIFARKDIPLNDGEYNETDLEKEFILFTNIEGKIGFIWNRGESDALIYETNDDGTISINTENVSILNEHIQSIGGVVCYGCYNEETETFSDPTDEHFDLIDTFLSYVIDSHTEIVERNDNEIYFKTNDGWENYNTLNLVNNLTDGGIEKALSAEMGKVLNEKITDFISGSNIESIKFKGYVNVDTKDGVDAIYEELSIDEACLVVPSTRNFGVSDGGTTMEDSYISWVLSQVYLCEDLYNFEPSSLVKNLSGLITGDLGELKTYFYLDKNHPYALCPDLLLLAKVKVRIKQFMELSGGYSKFILALIPDDATITACIGKIVRWSGGDFVAEYGQGLVDVGKWVENNRSSLNNAIDVASKYKDEMSWVESNKTALNNIISPKYSNILDHKYGWNHDMNWARETGIIGYTTNCEGGKPGGLDEFFTVIVFGSADSDPNYRTIVQFAYGRTGAATDRIWMRVLFEAVTTGHYNNFLPWLEITSGSMSSDISSIFENIDSLENSIEGLNASIENKQDVIEDLDTIRDGAAAGATALQEVPAEYVKKDELDSYSNIDHKHDSDYLKVVTDIEYPNVAAVNDNVYFNGDVVVNNGITLAETDTISATIDFDNRDGNKIVVKINSYDTIENETLAFKSDLNAKQNVISDLEDIRSGAAAGATALQEVPAEYVTETELAGKGYSTTTYVDEKVAALVNGAPDTLDTLDELAAALKDNKDIVTVLENSITSKQDKIEDLVAIREGASKGATALQSVPSEYVTETELSNKGYVNESTLTDYVKVDTFNNLSNTVSGKQDKISDLDTIRSNASNGNSAYAWGNHADAGYSIAGDVEATLTDYVKVDRFNNLSNTVDGKQDNISDLSTIRSNADNGATAYGWGNHADAGYSIAGDVEATLTDYVKVDTFNNLSNTVNGKQDKISDLDTIRSGAAAGATALQAVPAEYVTESELTDKGYLTANDLSFATNSDIESLFA